MGLSQSIRRSSDHDKRDQDKRIRRGKRGRVEEGTAHGVCLLLLRKKAVLFSTAFPCGRLVD